MSATMQQALGCCRAQPRRALVRCAARAKQPAWKQPPKEPVSQPVDVDDIHAEFLLPHEIEEAEEEARGLEQLAELRAEAAPEPPPAPAPELPSATPLEYVEVCASVHTRVGVR
jgi:hypothetical protein